MRWIHLAALGGLLLASPLLAQSDPPSGGASPPASVAPSDGEQQFKQITNEFDTAMKAFMADYRKATTDEERQKLVDAKLPKPESYIPRLMPLAQAHPNTPLARDVYVWAISHNAEGQTANEAFKALAENFATDQVVAKQVIPQLQWSQSPQAETLLRAAVEKNTDHQQKGMAQLTLGTYLKNNNRGAEAEKLLDDVAANYADVKQGKQSLAEQANNVLFEVRNLAIGKTAPEITGESIDGKPMKLSDFKGKVVVLDFFGDW
jgi:hypothetical protein